MKSVEDFENDWEGHQVRLEDLVAYWEIILGRLDRDELQDFDFDAVERHVTGCSRCTQELVDWDATDSILDEYYSTQTLSVEEDASLDVLIERQFSEWKSKHIPSSPMQEAATPEIDDKSAFKIENSPQPLTHAKRNDYWLTSLLELFTARPLLKWAPAMVAAVMVLVIASRPWKTPDGDGGVRGSEHKKLAEELSLEQQAREATPETRFIPPKFVDSAKRSTTPKPISPKYTTTPGESFTFKGTAESESGKFVLLLAPVRNNGLGPPIALQSSQSPRFTIPGKRLKFPFQWNGWWIEHQDTNGNRTRGPVALMRILSPQEEKEMQQQLSAFKFPKAEPEIRSRARFLFEFKTYLYFDLIEEARNALNNYETAPDSNKTLVDNLRKRTDQLTAS